MSDPLVIKHNSMAMIEELWEYVEKALNQSKATNQELKGVLNIINKEVVSFLNNCPYRDRLNMHIDVKDKTLADDLRKKGEQMLLPKVKRYIQAIAMFNESICFSEPGSENMARAYAHRAMICHTFRKYDECLQNITLARACDCPKAISEELAERENDAKQALQQEPKVKKKPKKGKNAKNEPPEELEISYGAHERVPQVAYCLELCKNEEIGYYITTKRRLKPGDVVMMERPHSSILLAKHRYVRCNFCHLERMFTLIPCDGCTVTMYCSKECMSKAYYRFHRYECKVIRDVWYLFGGGQVLALRTVCLAIAAFGHNMQAFKEHLNELESIRGDAAKVNAFDMDWTTATEQDIYDTVHMLMIHQKRKDPKDLVSATFYAVIIHNLLMERTELGVSCAAADNRLSKFLFDIMVHLLQNMKLTMHPQEYMEYRPAKKRYEPEAYGAGCYPLFSLLDHSCAPNVKRITLRDGRTAAVVVRPIQKGDKLYKCCGPHDHWESSRDERRDLLRKTYNFFCLCEACEFGYSQVVEADMFPDSSLDLRAMFDELRLHRADKAQELLPKVLRRLNCIVQQYPQNEIGLLQRQLLMSLRILHTSTSESEQYWQHSNP